MYDEFKDELFQLIETEMSDEEERLFTQSYKLYLQYGSNSKEFVINFDIVWNWVGYTRAYDAKKILIKYFTEHNDYKIVATAVAVAALIVNGKNLGGAGQNKETILLTVDCFKNFCMKAGTPRANEVRQYYIKMETILQKYIQSKFLELRNKDIHTQMTITDLQHKNTELEKFKTHEFLMDYNKKKSLVYFCVLHSFTDGSFLMKIGWTKDIETRIPALNALFGTKCIVLNAFVCENSYNLEQRLHNSTEIVKYKYTKLINNKVSSTEAYHIPNQKEYEKIVKITYTEMNNYNSIEITKLRIEEKKVDLVALLMPLCKSYDEVMNVLNKISSPFTHTNNTTDNTHAVSAADNDEEPTPVHVEPVTQTNTAELQEEQDEEQEQMTQNTKANLNGPIVQVYHKDDVTKVVQVFDSILEATRTFTYKNNTPSFTAIKKAHQHKILYLDHRWHFISNRKEPNLHQPRDIGETVITNERSQGQVVMLNMDKTKIIKVFKLAKDAAKDILQHPTAMSSAIKYSTPLANHYWMRWENVAKSLQDAYLTSNSLPEKPRNIRGIKINQHDPVTNSIVKTFASYTDIQKELRLSPRKIKEIIETKENYQGKYIFTIA